MQSLVFRRLCGFSSVVGSASLERGLAPRPSYSRSRAEAGWRKMSPRPPVNGAFHGSIHEGLIALKIEFVNLSICRTRGSAPMAQPGDGKPPPYSSRSVALPHDSAPRDTLLRIVYRRFSWKDEPIFDDEPCSTATPGGEEETRQAGVPVLRKLPGWRESRDWARPVPAYEVSWSPKIQDYKDSRLLTGGHSTTCVLRPIWFQAGAAITPRGYAVFSMALKCPG